MICENKAANDDFVRLYTRKSRQGIIARLGDPHKWMDDGVIVRYEVFGTDLFKKETNIKAFYGMKFLTETGEVGLLKFAFGNSGKFRLWFPAGTTAREGDTLILRFKRYAHDKNMHQDDIPVPPDRPGTRLETKPGVHKYGIIDKLKGDPTPDGKYPLAIASGLFAPEINIKEYGGTSVVLVNNESSSHNKGKIMGSILARQARPK